MGNKKLENKKSEEFDSQEEELLKEITEDMEVPPDELDD